MAQGGRFGARSALWVLEKSYWKKPEVEVLSVNPENPASI